MRLLRALRREKIAFLLRQPTTNPRLSLTTYLPKQRTGKKVVVEMAGKFEAQSFRRTLKLSARVTWKADTEDVAGADMVEADNTAARIVAATEIVAVMDIAANVVGVDRVRCKGRLKHLKVRHPCSHSLLGIPRIPELLAYDLGMICFSGKLGAVACAFCLTRIWSACFICAALCGRIVAK